MVYNQDFVDKNFSQNSRLQGVFTLGENRVEAERELLQLRLQIEKIDTQIKNLNNQLNGEDGQSGKRKELADLEPELRDKCFKQKQLHDDYFSVAYKGFRNDAEKFKNKILSERKSNTADLLTLEELKSKAGTVFSKAVSILPQLENINTESLRAAESFGLMQKIIVGNQDVDIAALIKHLGNSDWVRQGIKYHEKSPDTCPFCQQRVDEDFRDSLSSFFSNSYDNDIGELINFKNSYNNVSDHLLLIINRNIDSENPFLKIEMYRAQAQLLSERLGRNQSLIDVKIAEPSRVIELESVIPLFAQLRDLAEKANEATLEHNKTVDNIKDEKKVLTTQAWRFVINELMDDLSKYEQNKSKLSNTVAGMERSLSDEHQRRENLIVRARVLESQTTSIQPTVSAINDLLMKFGFNSFSIGADSGGLHYKIVRSDGADASRSLSEGEKTFITFLYFYHLIKGAQSPTGITASRVVVFDDPISSLDSDILYIVSSLIRSVIDDAVKAASVVKQVFVLTHNVYFHKEVSYSGSRKENEASKDESFWLIKKRAVGSYVERCDFNPIRSAYELLWSDVKSQNVSGLTFQNTLRRILENYFTMWGGFKKDEICARFDGADRLVCRSLFSWVNDGSHSIHDDLYVNTGEQTNRVYLDIFRKVFIEMGQKAHFDLMTCGTFDNDEQSNEQIAEEAEQPEPA